MRRLICLLIIMLFGAAAHADFDCMYDCSASHNLTPAPIRVLTNATGSNILAEKAAQSIIKKQIKKTSKGDYKVRLKSFSALDLKEGRFKSLEISGKDILVDNISVSRLDVKTLCDFNYIVPEKKNKSVEFREDLLMGYALALSENDLNNTMKTPEYDKVIKDINYLASAYSLFTIHSTQVKIKGDKFYYVIKVGMPFIRTTQDIVMQSDLKVRNGKIVFTDTQLINKRFGFDISRLAHVINYLNPLEFSLAVLDNKDTVVKVQNVNVADNMVKVSGTIYVPRDVVAKK